MTNNDIEKLQIIATTNDGEYLITITRSRPLIDLAVSMCEFQKCNRDLIEEMPITELTIKDEEQ